MLHDTLMPMITYSGIFQMNGCNKWEITREKSRRLTDSTLPLARTILTAILPGAVIRHGMFAVGKHTRS